jgi:protein-S-isoprenylcysteine O-methyltransferase Ste14
MTEQDQENPQSSPEVGAEAPVRHRHRFMIGTLFVLGTIVGVVAVLAVWANRQALNTDNFTNTSSQVLADQHVQTALSAYMVNQLFGSGAVEAQIKSALPAQLDALAGPINSGVEQAAGNLAPKVLASSQAQAAFRTSVHTSHATFMRIINGGGTAVSTNGGVVTLNLRALVDELAARLGIQEQVAAARSKLQQNAGTIQGAASKAGITLPANDGQFVIMRSSQLKTVQDVASAIKGLAIVLPLLTFALFIFAVWLARDRRRPALRMTGWLFVTIGLITLLARRVLGNYIVDSLVKNQSNKTAVHDIWTISTSMLYDIAVVLVVFGLVVVAAAWLAGHTRPATALRRAMAPTLREHPAAAYGTVYGALLLLVLWGPAPAFRQLGYIIAFAVLLTLGVHTLRRQTASEFPDAQAGDTMRAIRDRNAARQQPATPAVATAGANGGRVAELERLARLHDNGSLTDDEFATEKAALHSSL